MSRKKKSFAFFLWHRRLGLTILILIILLSVSGILLNHTDSLELDNTPVESNWILDWYGINPQGESLNCQTQDIWIAQWQQQLFFNASSLYVHNERLHGCVIINDIIGIALDHTVMLLDTEGEIIEVIPVTTRAAIQNIGIVEDKIALIDIENNHYLSNTDITRWVEVKTLKAKWSTLAQISPQQKEQLKVAYRGQGLSMERVILDLHSGRFFNPLWGILLMDLVALGIIFLALSGLWVWWSRKQKMRKKKHYQKHH